MTDELANPPTGLSMIPAHPTPAQMLYAVIEKGVTPENVAAVGELVKLHERMQDRDAERQFSEAFVALQKELPVIVASSEIPKRGKYERYEDVMDQIQPLLTAHGFTVSFSQDFRDDRIIQTCRLKHIGGHSESNSFGVRTGRADDATQADSKASTTAKRNALLNALNIIIRRDALQDEEGDGRLEGAPINQEQADKLEAWVKETGRDIAKFLQMAGAERFDQIPASRYERLVGGLELILKRRLA